MSYVVAGVAVVGLVSSAQQSDVVMANGRLRKQINDLNAEFAEVDAYEAEKFGFTEAARYQTVIDSTIADQRVAYASQGVDVNYGTAADMQAEARTTGVLNLMDIKRAARQKALGIKREASQLRVSGEMQMGQASSEASSMKSAGILNAGAMVGNRVASGYGKKGG